MQKGGIPGVPGCLVTQLIREAREGKDLVNAFGSIPHKLVETVLEWHHIPNNIKDLIMDYYDNFNLGFTSHQSHPSGNDWIIT